MICFYFFFWIRMQKIARKIWTSDVRFKTVNLLKQKRKYSEGIQIVSMNFDVENTHLIWLYR